MTLVVYIPVFPVQSNRSDKAAPLQKSELVLLELEAVSDGGSQGGPTHETVWSHATLHSPDIDIRSPVTALTAIEQGPDHLFVFGDALGGRYAGSLNVCAPESEEDEIVGHVGALSQLGSAENIRSRVQCLDLSFPRVASVVEDGTVMVEDVTKPLARPLWKSAADVITSHSVIWQDENTLLTAGSSGYAQVQLWDIRSPGPVLTFRDPAAGAEGLCLALRPDRKSEFLLGSSHGELGAWDTRQPGRHITQLYAHHGPVWSLGWVESHPRCAVSSGQDGAVLLWDLLGFSPVDDWREPEDRHAGAAWDELGKAKRAPGIPVSYVLHESPVPCVHVAMDTHSARFAVLDAAGSLLGQPLPLHRIVPPAV